MNLIFQKDISNFPMGPQIRGWLNISENKYKGHENPTPTAEQAANFTDAFLLQLEESTPKNSDHLVDLLEELVGMNLPLLAIKLVDAYPTIFPGNDFRAQLHCGNAAMLVNDLARAEIAFIAAQSLVAEEPAPYINLTQIYCHDGLYSKAEEWCLAGLDCEPDNTRLWELLAWLKQQTLPIDCIDQSSVANSISQIANSKNSWAGRSLACDLVNPEDVLTKAAALEKFWDEGCQNIDFLIEFTAVLGMAGRYDRIPPVIWQIEKQASSSLPWQLTLHLAQAYLGLGRDQDALSTLEKLNKISNLPDQAKAAAQSMLHEVTLSTSKN